MSSDSSDDEVLNFLPGTGATGGFNRPGPKRARNFAAMLNDSDSDEDVKHKPAPAAATKVNARAPSTSSSDSSDDSSSASIQFAPSGGAGASASAGAARSMSPSSATDISFSPEAPKKAAAAPAPKPTASITSTTASSAKPVATKPTPEPVVAAVTAPATPIPTPQPQAFPAVPVAASPAPAVPPPQQQVVASPPQQLQPPPQQPQTVYMPPQTALPPYQQAYAHQQPAAVNLTMGSEVTSIVPHSAPPMHTAVPQALHTPSTSMVAQPYAQRVPMTPPSYGSGGEEQQRASITTPLRAREQRMDNNVDELLARAQQRLRERQYNTGSQAGTRAASPAMNRLSTPMKTISSPVNGRYGSVGRAQTPSALAAPPLLPPDFSKESRAQKESQRLAEEVNFLATENHRLRNNSSAITGASSVEITKLELQLEVAKKQCRDAEVDAQRTRRLLEEQLRDISEHRDTLQEEVTACMKSVAQFEQMAKDKDAQLVQEQAMTMRLKSDLADAQQEATRYRDDLTRQSIEWSAKLDRNLALLEDMKRQRNHLTELNDKVTRDKDSAVAERKRLFDELRQCVADRNREKDAYAEEVSALKREAERYRSMLQDKERVLNAQLVEERKAKEALHGKLLEIESSASKDAKSLDVQLRAQQDDHRHMTQRMQDQLHQAASDLRQAKQEVEELRGMLDSRVERERFDQQQEYNDHVFKLRREVEEHAVSLRNAESARDLALRECDRYKEELKGAGGIVAQWKAAKDKAEAQNHQLTTTISLLMESDDGHGHEKENLKAELDARDADIRQLQADLEQAYEVEHRYKDLLEENERLSTECTRIARERDELVDENGKMATEVLKWRDEVKDMLLRSNKVGGGYAGRPSTASSAMGLNSYMRR